MGQFVPAIRTARELSRIRGYALTHFKKFCFDTPDEIGHEKDSSAGDFGP
jgi:hypothetical protein